MPATRKNTLGCSSTTNGILNAMLSTEGCRKRGMIAVLCCTPHLILKLTLMLKAPPSLPERSRRRAGVIACQPPALCCAVLLCQIKRRLAIDCLAPGRPPPPTLHIGAAHQASKTQRRYRRLNNRSAPGCGARRAALIADVAQSLRRRYGRPFPLHGGPPPLCLSMPAHARSSCQLISRGCGDMPSALCPLPLASICR
jgi:hypothetical protein